MDSAGIGAICGPTVRLSHPRLALGPERPLTLTDPATSEMLPTPLTRLSEPVMTKISGFGPTFAVTETVSIPVVHGAPYSVTGFGTPDAVGCWKMGGPMRVPFALATKPPTPLGGGVIPPAVEFLKPKGAPWAPVGKGVAKAKIAVTVPGGVPETRTAISAEPPVLP